MKEEYQTSLPLCSKSYQVFDFSDVEVWQAAPDQNSFRLKEKNTIQNQKLDFQQRLICLLSLFCMAS